jgi:hypothetical protein
MRQVCILASLVVSLSGPAWAEWSIYGPIAKQTAPNGDDSEWSAPIDAFVYSALNEAGLTPAPAVNRRVWIRRVTFDLTGLPPLPRDVQSLIDDPRSDADAMGDVVDRLLASPRYGERWGRHWLDVVRYADTDGFAIDEERLWLWRYRDYVIRVFNEDRPFDEFIREQIAGDELESGDGGKVAISFYRLGPWEADNMTKEHRWQDYLNDITSSVSSTFLGLTVGCARCHDHKFDPIEQADFYRLQAFFSPIKRAALTTGYLPNEDEASLQRRHHDAAAQRLSKISAVRAELREKIGRSKGVSPTEISDAELNDFIKAKREPVTEEDVSKLNSLSTAKDHLRPEQRFESRVTAIRNANQDENFKDAAVLNNGDPFDRGDEVTPGFLSAVPVWSAELARKAHESGTSRGGRRKILAEWLTDPNNPITPRVLANRVWQYHFGTGIVATPNDFGENGSGPSHPALLDYLAGKLVHGKWRLKPLHREIVLSRAYRSSVFHPDSEKCREVDPDGRLLWRSHYRRLESEAIRDTVLAVSGRLRFEAGGPGFLAALPEGMGSSYPFFKWEPSSEEQRRRRSVFMFQRRNLVHPMMEAFDGADLNVSCERRENSVTAPQALSLFNSQFVHRNSLHLAQRLCADADDDSKRVERLFWLALSRGPTDDESLACVEFLDEKRRVYSGEDGDEQSDPDLQALRDLSLAIINTNEFLYLD